MHLSFRLVVLICLLIALDISCEDEASYGLTVVKWVPRTNIPGSSDGSSWSSITSSADGLRLAACGSKYIYTSNDGGETWLKQECAGKRSWHVLAMSQDGKSLAACEN